MPNNETESVCYLQPRTTAQRLAIAGDFTQRFHYGIPLVVDPIENVANRLYAGWPERLYVVEAGVIRYKGGQGPFEFHPEELADWLAKRFPEIAALPEPPKSDAGAAAPAPEK
jgi:hypothetical protein